MLDLRKMIESKCINFYPVENCSYEQSMHLQRVAMSKVKNDPAIVELLAFEYPATITLGRRLHHGSMKNENKNDTEFLNSSEINNLANKFEIIASERGGEATLHSPGQLVIYPILNLRDYFTVRDWVCFLLKVTQNTLQEYGISSSTAKGAGLWTDLGKITFIGLRVQQGISTHGISINIQNDLTLFKHITSCGIKNESFDRVANYNSQITTQDFFLKWKKIFLTQIKLN